MNDTIKKAIEACGSQKKLAKAVQVSQMTISLWLRGGGINAKHIPLIAKATGYQVTERELLDSLCEPRLPQETCNGTQ